MDMKLWTLIGGAACAVGVAVAVPLLLAPAAPGPANAGLPPGVAQRLTAIAERADHANGGKPVLWASVVSTTRSKALTSATPGDFVPVGGSAAVYLITMRGSFTDDVSVPGGATGPTGHYLSLVVNAATFESLDFGLAPGPPPVSPASLGPVTYLKL
jgi:hypothetical protein